MRRPRVLIAFLVVVSSIAGFGHSAVRSEATTSRILDPRPEASQAGAAASNLTAKQTALVDEFLALGEQAGNQNERIPYDLAARCVRSNEAGLLALFIAVANWGVDWSDRTPPPDPAGLRWKGPPIGNGKHLEDYRKGGLGIVHIDSSFLQRDTYGRWGRPEGIPDRVLDTWLFDQIRVHRVYGEKWRNWAKPLVENREFQYWVIGRWLADYWEPARDGNPDVATAVVNARIRNSVSGVGARLSGKSLQEQMNGYIDYMRRRRGEPSAARVKRQLAQALRVKAIIEVSSVG